jgi:hypothetical protein
MESHVNQSRMKNGMKTRFAGMARISLVSIVLLAGLVYSVLALTLTAKPVYASSCDCVTAQNLAEATCVGACGFFELQTFQCPNPGDPTTYSYSCAACNFQQTNAACP